MVRIVTEEEIADHLTIEQAISAIEDLHRRLSDGEAMTDLMETILTPVSDPPENTTSPVYHGLRTMDGAIYGADVASVRISSDIIHWPHKGEKRVREKLPLTNGQYNGFVVLFNTNTGEPLGIFPDAIIQHLRVGASSALAAKYLANNNASKVGMLGAGWQARAHVPALDLVHDLDLIEVFSPTSERRNSFADEMNKRVDTEVVAVDTPEAVFVDADIIQCVTNSTAPVFEMDWVESGTHVTIIRLPEGPEEFFDLDSVDAFATNWPPNVDQYEMYGGNLRMRHIASWVWNHYAIKTDEPIPKLQSFDDVKGDLDWDAVSSLAEIMEGDAPGRTSPTDITGFFTSAVGVDFTAVSKILYDVAEAKELGQELPLGLFSQDHHP